MVEKIQKTGHRRSIHQLATGDTSSTQIKSILGMISHIIFDDSSCKLDFWFDQGHPPTCEGKMVASSGASLPCCGQSQGRFGRSGSDPLIQSPTDSPPRNHRNHGLVGILVGIIQCGCLILGSEIMIYNGDKSWG